MVIWLHCRMSGTPMISYFIMPLFFFLSGCLYKKRNFIQFIKKRIASLYVPFIIYELVFLGLRNTFLKLGFYRDPSLYWMQPLNWHNVFALLVHIFLFDNADQLLATLWFPTCLFFTEVFYCILDNLIENNLFRGFICCICLLAANISFYNGKRFYWSYNFKTGFSVILTSVFFFWLGTLVTKNNLVNFKAASMKQLCIGIVGFIPLFFAYRWKISFDYRAFDFSNPIACFFLSIIGIFSCIFLFNVIYYFNGGFVILCG